MMMLISSFGFVKLCTGAISHGLSCSDDLCVFSCHSSYCRICLRALLGLGMGLVKQTCEVQHDEVCPIQIVIASVFGRLNGRNGNTSEAGHFQTHPPVLALAQGRPAQRMMMRRRFEEFASSMCE